MTTKVASFNHTDTPISGVTVNPVNLGLVNYGADFRIEKNTADELILTNMRAPIGDPERFRWAYGITKDIFANSDIDRSERGQNSRGISIVGQHTDIMSVTDTADASFLAKYPWSGHFVIKAPAVEYVTADMVKAYFLRTAAAMYETGLNDSARIAALLRGSLLPADLR